MADLTRRFPWSSTPVGPIDRWPDTLLTTVNMLLANRHPMFLWWGSDLIQFYNDGYRPSLGGDKHPRALGQCGIDCWPEIWPIIGPQIDAVMSSGAATWHEDQLVPIYRDGKLEDVYWTYSYSPVRDPAGNVRGVLVTVSETTQKVLAQQQLTQVLEATTDSILGIDRDWRITYMNAPAKLTTGPIFDIIGKDLWQSFPAALYEGSPFVEHYTRAMNERTPAEFEAFYPTPSTSGSTSWCVLQETESSFSSATSPSRSSPPPRSCKPKSSPSSAASPPPSPTRSTTPSKP